MEVSLLRVADRIKKLKLSKWLPDKRHLAAQLGILVGQLVTFLQCIKCGDIKVNGTWRLNSVSYDMPIKLSDTRLNNKLKLH